MGEGGRGALWGMGKWGEHEVELKKGVEGREVETAVYSIKVGIDDVNLGPAYKGCIPRRVYYNGHVPRRVYYLGYVPRLVYYLGYVPRLVYYLGPVPRRVYYLGYVPC